MQHQDFGFSTRIAHGFGALCAALALTAAAAAHAADNFTVTVTAQGQTVSQGATTLRGLEEIGLESDGLEDVFPNYSDQLPAIVDIGFRGLPLRVTYEGSGLTLSIDELGVIEQFDEGDRRASEDALGEYLENDTDGTLSAILNWAVSNTATDPVAGNPSSLQGQMIAGDFRIGTDLDPGGSVSAGGAGAGEEREGRASVLGLGARFGRYSVGDDDVTTIELPFQYVLPLADPRYAVIFDAPLTYTEVNGADSWAGSIGVGFRYPVLTNWDLTPSVRAGIVGSEDLGTLAATYTASLSSNLTFDLGAVGLTIGNMISYVETTDAGEVDGYNASYDLQNTVFRNGFEVATPIGGTIFGLPMTAQGSVVNTQITGDDVFIDNYTDFAISIGTEESRNGLTWDSLRLGLTYTTGVNDYESFRLNFGYRF